MSVLGVCLAYQQQLCVVLIDIVSVMVFVMLYCGQVRQYFFQSKSNLAESPLSSSAATVAASTSSRKPSRRPAVNCRASR